MYLIACRVHCRCPVRSAVLSVELELIDLSPKVGRWGAKWVHGRAGFRFPVSTPTLVTYEIPEIGDIYMI